MLKSSQSGQVRSRHIFKSELQFMVKFHKFCKARKVLMKPKIFITIIAQYQSIEHVGRNVRAKMDDQSYDHVSPP